MGYELLTNDEKELFGRLAVFVGSFDLDAAEVVCGADLDALQSLVDKSLVRDTGAARFFLLETIREFATELLGRSGEIESVGSRHADYYGGVAEQGEPGLQSAEDRQWLARFDAERDNFRAAFAFARDHDLPELALRLIAALRLYWGARVSTASFGGGSMRRSSMPETRRRSSVRMRSKSRRWCVLGRRLRPDRAIRAADAHDHASARRPRARSERADEIGAAASGMGDGARSRA